MISLITIYSSARSSGHHHSDDVLCVLIYYVLRSIMCFASASFVLPFLVFDLAMTLNCNSLRFAKAYSRYGKTTEFAHETIWKFLNHQS